MSTQLTRSAAASLAVLIALALWAPTVAPVDYTPTQVTGVATIAAPVLA
ncbi:hypothetical protein [Croceicoccus bisphenolivorans]|nr:hypothetical protein [Croceicoccus bisphenolivorans]